MTTNSLCGGYSEQMHDRRKYITETKVLNQTMKMFFLLDGDEEEERRK